MWLQIWLTILGEALKSPLEYCGGKVGKWLGVHVTHRLTLPETIERTQALRNKMAELRVLVGADRVGIFQFHNGGTFSNKNPQWRVSCTDEVHAPGVEPADASTQAVFASRLMEMVAHLFDKKLMQDHVSCPGENTFLLSVDRMADGFTRNLLCVQGVRSILQSPLFDRDGMICGYLAADFCDFGHGTHLGDQKIVENLAAFQRYVPQIEFALVAKTPMGD
jgi:hypothetical protein